MRLLILFCLVVLSGIAMVFMPSKKESKIHGVSLVNPPREISKNKLSEVKRVNADWVAIIPYGFSYAGAPEVSYDHADQWWGERTQGTCQLVNYAKSHGLKVMLKPHVWVIGQGWTGDFDLSEEDQWEVWERDFLKYILNYATVADSLGVELLCIGTEYRIPARERPAFWRGLIKDVRNIYSGKITYAANWDNYDRIDWWDAVDYMGIDAYFPLVEKANPSVDEIAEGWQPIKDEMLTFSKAWNKPILFTEYGFLSVNGATGKHWELDKSVANANDELQAKAYEATYRMFMDESDFIGGFLWKWHLTMRSGDWYKTQWTPQGKATEKVIADWYGRD